MKKQSAQVRHVLRRPENVPGLPKSADPAWPGVAGTLLLAHALLAFIALLLRQAWPMFDQLVSSDSWLSYVVGAVLMQGGLILLPTLIVVMLAKIQPRQLLGGKPRAGSLILGVIIGIPAAVVFQGMNNLLIYGLAKAGLRLPAVTGPEPPGLFSRPIPIMLLVIVVSAVIPGIVEELMFRGVIFVSLTSTGAVLSAGLWQAAAFSLFHGNPFFILPPFLAGMMLATIRRNSDSLLPAILAHISLNLSLAALTPLLPSLTADYLTSTSGEAPSLFYASLVAALVAAVALVPMLVLINLPAGRERPSGRLVLVPVDWKFILAFIILIAAMIIEYN